MPGQAIVTIRDKQWQVSIADMPWELVQGLSELPEMPPGTGMFFDTGSTQTIQVTTIFMLFPIDIAFLSETLVVTEVYRNIEPGYIVTSTTPARYFLEVNAGELEGIDSGDRASIELLPAPLWLPEIPWDTVIAVFMGSVVMFSFIVAVIRFIEGVLTPPKKKMKLNGPRDDRLLPQTEKTKYEEIAYELLEDPEFWFDVYRVKDLTGLSYADASKVMEVLSDKRFLAKARAFYEGMRYPPRSALGNIRAIEKAIGGGSNGESLLPQIAPPVNEDFGLPLRCVNAGRDWILWETTLEDKKVTVEVTDIRGLERPRQLEEAFALSTARIYNLVAYRELPFAAAARGKLWWLATIQDRPVQVEVTGIRVLTERQLEDAFADSVAVIDVIPKTPIYPQTTAKPTRDDVEIGTWVERDRTGIWVTDKRTDKTIAEWWDEAAQEMFEQGWFKLGDISHQTITGRHFEESVLDYLEDRHIVAKGNPKARVIPTEPRPRRPREEVEFWPDSPEMIAQTIDAIGYREQIDTAFMEAIKRAKGLR